MSSAKQEVAAILMNYTEHMSEEAYMSILNDLSKIPDHKDPKKASEIQQELDQVKIQLAKQIEENDMLIEQLEEAEEYLDSTNQVLDTIMGGPPIYEDDETILYNKTTDTVPSDQRPGGLHNALFLEENTDEEEDLDDSSSIGTFDCDISQNDDLSYSKETNMCGWPIQCLFKSLKIFNNSANNYYGHILLHEKNCYYDKPSNNLPFWKFRYGKLLTKFERYKYQRTISSQMPSREIPIRLPHY